MLILKTSPLNLEKAQQRLEKMWNECKTYDDYAKTGAYLAIIVAQLKKYNRVWEAWTLTKILNAYKNDAIFKPFYPHITIAEQPKPHRDMYWKVPYNNKHKGE